MAALNQRIAGVTKAAAVPAAGAEVALTADEPFFLQTFRVQLVSDANVANRQVRFTVEDAAGRIFAEFISGGTQAASLTRQYTGLQVNFTSPALVDTLFTVAIPAGPQGLYVPQGGVIRTKTTLIQAGDAYGALTVSGERVQ